VFLADFLHGANIRHGNRLSASGIVRHGQHHERNLFRAFAFDEFSKLRRVHVPLEGMHARGLLRFGDGQVHGDCADEFAVGARRVKVRIVRHNLALLAHHVEKDSLRRAALMRRNHVPKTEDRLHGITKSREAGRACVGFVAAHHRRPLFGGHRRSARIRQQVDEDRFRRHEEQVVACRFDQTLAFLARGLPNRLDALDAKRFNDRSLGHDPAPPVSLHTMTCKSLHH
jgi:hypothetical protein